MGTSMASREKDSADFDLEAFIDLFDEALTSDDPGVKQTLQHLMVIAALARNHARHDHRDGPMRRMFENQRDLIRRMDRLESDQQRIYPGGGLGGGSVPLGPYVPGTPWPGTGGGTGWPLQPGTYPPGTIWAQNKTSTSVTLDPEYGAIPPSSAASAVAERVEDLLKSSYRGSSVGANNKV
jgi:hypothetical protein